MSKKDNCACGPDWIPDYIVDWYLDVPRGEECLFHDACLIHDQDYKEGILTQKECDDKFLKTMQTIAKASDDPEANLKEADNYYEMVRRWGWISYNASRVSGWFG